MKKITKQKLALETTTIRELSPSELETTVGGMYVVLSVLCQAETTKCCTNRASGCGYNPN